MPCGIVEPINKMYLWTTAIPWGQSRDKVTKCFSISGSEKGLGKSVEDTLQSKQESNDWKKQANE